MAELSKQALKVQNNTEFPNNNAGLITPTNLRTFNVDMIDSLVDEISYNVDSASWNQQIDALEQFTASAAGLSTGSLLVTASAAGNVITFTKGDASTFNVTVATGSIPDISALNQATASLQAYTASANVRFTNLESTTASLNTSVTNINTFTASAAISITNLNASSASQQISINNLNGATGSYATTGSNTFTGANTFTSISASSFVSASEFIGNGSKITGITASIALPILDEGIPQGNAVSMNFTGSGISAVVVGGTAVVSVNIPDASVLNALTASFNAYTTSTDLDLAAIHQATASLQTNSASVNTSVTNLNSATASLFTSTSLSLTTASFDNGNRNLTFSKGDGTTFAVNIPDVSGSAGDFVTTASFNSYTQSNDQKVDSLIAATGSYATTGSNTFTGNQTISSSAGGGDYIINAAGTNGTVTYGQTGGGNFQISQSGSAIMRGTNSTAFEIYATASFIAAPSIPNITSDLKVNGNFTASLQEGYVWVGNVSGVSTTVSTSSFGGGSVPAGTISGSAQITALGFVSSSVTASSLVTASIAGADITFTKGDGSTFTITTATGSVASASYAETASLAINAKDIIVDVKNTTGVQIDKGTVVRIIGATGDNPLIGTASWEDDNNSANTLGFVVADIANDAFGRVMTQGTLLAVDTDPTLGYAAGDLVYLSSSGQFTRVKPPAPYHEVRLGQVLRAQQNNGSIYVLIQNGYELDELHDVSINTGSLANNDLLAYDSASTQWTNKTLTQLGALTTSSFVNPSIQSISGSVLITANGFTSGAANLTHISASAQDQANILFKNTNTAGSTIVSGSFNLYTNPSAPAAGRLNYLENSNIFLNDSGFLPTVTASVLAAGGFYPRLRNNLWLGTGPWTINTNRFAASSTLAGSFNNNLFLGSTGTTINTLGNTVGPTFSHNIMANAGATINAPSRSIAEINAGQSGSNTISFIGNASFGGTTTYNGPVSCSIHTISGNNTQGTLTLNLQSGSRQYTISQNITNGTLTINDNTVFAPTLPTANTFSQNNINGTITLTNRASASIGITANTLSGFTITNDFDASTNGTNGRTFVLQGNVIAGFAANNIYFSGSAAGANSANERGRGLYGNVIGGSRISASVIGDGNRSLLASAVWGQGLSVYGTGLYDASNAANAGGANGGSAFFGRWNAEDGNRALSAQTVFAVGTGTSGSAGLVRKTGFLIDSGSNTFIEGTLNVSGASTLNGDTIITGSLTLSSSAAIELNVVGNSTFTGSVAGNVLSASITSNTASIDFSLANYFEVTSSVTPLHLNVTNITPGRTSTLIISASASSSILFSPNVAQPSGSAYSGSAGSIDILSLVAFNTSKVNLVSTKNMI